MTGGDACDTETRAGRRQCSKRRLGVLGGIVVLLLAVGAYAFLPAQADDAGAESEAAGQVTSVPVKRMDLVQTAAFDGTLSYANARTITAIDQGVVTALPPAGAVISQGEQLYAVNASGTYLLYGSVPMYRTLSAGVSDGPDIQQLESALKALGFDPDEMAVDEHWGSSTTAAVNAWKESIGLPEKGRLTAQEVQFAPGPVRVDSLSVVVGQRVSANAGLYVVTDTSREVVVPLQLSDASIATVDAAVTVRLPDGASATGRVQSIATSAATSSATATNTGGGSVNASGPSDATTSATVDVTVALADDAAVGSLATAPVTVVFSQQWAEDVLAVPVTALLAVTDGGFAVEIDDGGGRSHLVPVTPGLYSADGYVEVSGPDLAEGMRVTVPASS